MAGRTQVALRKQLLRELKHRSWLQKNLPNTEQQRQSQRKILVARTELARQLGQAVQH